MSIHPSVHLSIFPSRSIYPSIYVSRYWCIMMHTYACIIHIYIIYITCVSASSQSTLEFGFTDEALLISQFASKPSFWSSACQPPNVDHIRTAASLWDGCHSSLTWWKHTTTHACNGLTSEATAVSGDEMEHWNWHITWTTRWILTNILINGAKGLVPRISSYASPTDSIPKSIIRSWALAKQMNLECGPSSCATSDVTPKLPRFQVPASSSLSKGTRGSLRKDSHAAQNIIFKGGLSLAPGNKSTSYHNFPSYSV